MGFSRRKCRASGQGTPDGEGLQQPEVSPGLAHPDFQERWIDSRAVPGALSRQRRDVQAFSALEDKEKLS